MTAGSIEGAGSYFLGSKELTVGLNNLSTKVSGTIADGGSGGGTGGMLIKTGTGTLMLTGSNTYSGGTLIDLGTLIVSNAQALGRGSVIVNGGILSADTRPINVLANYIQKAGGTLQLQVAGANPGQYGTLSVGGNAGLGGTLQLISLGFQPKAGDQLRLVTTGGVVSGRFAHFVDPFVTGPGFNTAELVYGRNSVLLEFLNLARATQPLISSINFSSFALTPHQPPAANLLDAVQADPKAANLINSLNKEPFSNLPADLEEISPEGLTAFYEIGFSDANIQRLNVEGRLDDIRNGSNGFSSNMKVNGATVNLEDRGDADGKASKSVVEPILQHGSENRWGIWLTGFGDFVSVDSDANAKGYDFTTGGVSLGVDYRLTAQFAIGVMGDYSHTWTELQPSGHIDVDTGRGGMYATWFNHGIYLNGAIYSGHNTYESNRSSLGGLASGSTEGAEWSAFVSGGYDFHFGLLSIGPIAALQYTYVNIDGFNEKSSVAPLQIHSGSAESLRSDVGFRAYYQWQIGKILVEPSLKAAWEHEYKYSALPIAAGFAGIPAASATFLGPNEGHDSAVVSAGVSVQLTSSISTYVNYDGQLGREGYDSNAVTGGVRIRF
jgi:outer membrane autotransporter protein